MDHSPCLRQLTYLAILSYFIITKAHFEASSNDQDKNIRSRVKGKRQIESSKGKRGNKDKDYVDASSNGLKYSVQAKIPAIHGGMKEQLISNKRCQPCYHPSDSRGKY
ncbi:hypothetical protein Peur_009052 [Populus x canadensis]